ncbi:discoidin domain-containing protein [Actinacidiphila soli]|uniref:discoidin domain-containing protein n=1 Tax=Actinacidiphila soli TaxID=2487275 RepID=UPI0038992AFB
MSQTRYARRRRRASTSRSRLAALLGFLMIAVLGLTSTPQQAVAADPVLLSQGKAATASSTENAGSPASAAVDGDTGTRWSSAFSDPQ